MKIKKQYVQKEILGGLFVERTEIVALPKDISGFPPFAYGSSAFIMNKRKFKKFLHQLEVCLEKLLSFRLTFATKKLNPQEHKNLQRKAIKVESKFNQKYRNIINKLVSKSVGQDRRVIPLIDTRYFPRNTNDSPYLWKFTDIIHRYYGIDRGPVRGKPSANTEKEAQKRQRLADKGLSSVSIAQKVWPEEFRSDEGDPIPKLKKRISRRKKQLNLS